MNPAANARKCKGFDRQSKPAFEWPKNLAEFDAYQWERDQKKEKTKQDAPSQSKKTKGKKGSSR